MNLQILKVTFIATFYPWIAFRPVNLTKKTEKGLINIPEIGDVKDYLSVGDTVYCDIYTHNYWIKTKFKITSNQNKLGVTIDIKSQIDDTFEDYKLLLMKTGLNFWINLNEKNDLHYIYQSSEFKTSKSHINFISEGFGIDEADKEKLSDLPQSIPESIREKDKEKERRKSNLNDNSLSLSTSSKNSNLKDIKEIREKEVKDLRRPEKPIFDRGNSVFNIQNKKYNKSTLLS